MLEEFRVSIHEELDYEREAENLRAPSAATSREFDAHRRAAADPRLLHAARAHDGARARHQDHQALGASRAWRSTARALLDELFHAYLKQVLVDGLFHADPHPGNVFITDDGRLALLDLGMVGRTTPGMQEHLLKILHRGERRAQRAGRRTR